MLVWRVKNQRSKTPPVLRVREREKKKKKKKKKKNLYQWLSIGPEAVRGAKAITGLLLDRDAILFKSRDAKSAPHRWPPGGNAEIQLCAPGDPR